MQSYKSIFKNQTDHLKLTISAIQDEENHYHDLKRRWSLGWFFAYCSHSTILHSIKKNKY